MFYIASTTECSFTKHCEGWVKFFSSSSFIFYFYSVFIFFFDFFFSSLLRKTK